MTEPTEQTSLVKANLFAYSPTHRIHFPVEGIVVVTHFPGDTSNETRRQIEYNVFIPSWGDIIPNVPLAVGLSSILDEDETRLVPAGQIVTLSEGKYAINLYGGTKENDGDQVLVHFINGSGDQPIITNILPHSQRGNIQAKNAKYDGKLELLSDGATGDTGYEFGDGTAGKTAADLGLSPMDRTRHTAINGTHLALDRNGDLFVNFKAHPNDDKNLPAGDVKKKLVIQNEGVDFLRVEWDGSNVHFVIAENFASEILTQVGDGAVSVAIAETLEVLWGDLNTWLDAHVHPTGVGPSGPPTPPLSATNAPWDPDINSDKVTIPDN